MLHKANDSKYIWKIKLGDLKNIVLWYYDIQKKCIFQI